MSYDWYKLSARMFIGVVWLSANIAPTIVFAAQNFEMSKGASNFTTGLLLCFMLPAFSLGFTTFALLRFVIHKLKLDNPLSVGKEFIPRAMLIEQEEKALAE